MKSRLLEIEFYGEVLTLRMCKAFDNLLSLIEDVLL